jgi:signal transduction histidine kinase
MSTAELVLENKRLEAELAARVAELGACRARVLKAAEYARRIERDLHDGAQQRLVSLAMSLGLLDAKLPADPCAAKRIIREARRALAATLRELRELSQGIYPSVLTERGLAGALGELRDRSALPTRLEVLLESRPSAEAEAATYFVVSEAVTNATKHSRAGELWIAVSQHGSKLVAEVGDDGIGGAAPKLGSGLRGLADRVEELGGQLIVSSLPGRGTTVRAEIPCDSRSPARVDQGPGARRSALARLPGQRDGQLVPAA